MQLYALMHACLVLTPPQNLAHNRIEDMSVFHSMPDLISLNLDHNKISKINLPPVSVTIVQLCTFWLFFFFF